MLNFRQKILLSYVLVFLIFIACLFPLVSRGVHYIVIKAIEDRTTEIIQKIKDAPNNEALIHRLKDQKSTIFFRVAVINQQHEVLYDSHLKRLLGPKFSQEFVIDHPEVNEAFEKGIGFYEGESDLLKQKFSYFAKSFNFHGQTYVLRAAFPYQYLSEATRDFEYGFLAFSSLSLLLFGLFNWLAIQYLTKPIHHIIKSIKPYQDDSQNPLPMIDVSMLSSGGEFTKLALTLNDLSARIQRQFDTILQEKNEKAAILESLVEGVIAIDNGGYITYANHAAISLLNHKGDIVGRHFPELEKPGYWDLLQKCCREKLPMIEEFHVVAPSGKKLFLEAVAAPKEGNEGAILVLQDKTALHKIYEMRRDFIANASHELKTPITVIKGFAEALHDNPNLPREVQEQITGKITKNCLRMTCLIKDLLTLADIENIPSSRLTECDLFLLADDCRAMVQEVFPTAQITIEQSEPDIHLIADRELLDLAIMNLVENAAKYSKQPAKIEIQLKNYSDHIEIHITDHGMGIPFQDQEHIFDRFYTVDKAHSQKMGGSGLGLSIVKTIIEKHFGTIVLESEVGKGTKFTIKLPKKEAED